MFKSLKRVIFGAPLASHQEEHERLSVPLGLAVFASDSLSSSAYATEEILLALVGTSFAVSAGLIAIPVAMAIGLLLVIVVISYRQVIRAYPQSGGAYVVSKENLGVLPSLIAGSALMIDYILTVAVSISAGVAALTSTRWVSQDYSVPLALSFVLLITLVNLRGVRESGKVIAIPAYIFIGSMFLLIVTGLWQTFTGASLPMLTTAPPVAETAVDWWNWALMLAFLKAFSHGCAALTGTEAVSNGVTAFKPPESVNANRTLVIMSLILGVIFIGLTTLAYLFHIVPSAHETVVSQIARAVFGGESPLYFIVQLSTMVILILAANTSFAGFPRLSSLLANDGFLPRQLMTLGDKLVFSNGIWLLGLVSGFLVWLYHADTHALIPLYAVGVFITFTLAQIGMVVYHRREKEPGARWGSIINTIGALVTGFVAILLTAEKFMEGAWIILVAIPLFIAVFFKIYYHYKSLGKQLAMPQTGVYCPSPVDHTVLVLVSSLNRGTIPALQYAQSISKRVEAVHIKVNEAGTERLKAAWKSWGCEEIPLVILDSPYRSINEPLLNYIKEVDDRYQDDLLTVIIPEFVTRRWWHNLLHNQSSILIKAVLRQRRGTVVTTVRYHLEE